ncbi:hypothetical protein [Methylorubrum suomiense]|uniref:Uncharacterized protein n=1 Tax=Methylorubrum suomiense TaxID=144191 RepID=A0ABQ4V158_9HYPH|nr:hypothetical protein [Methylorubrum suomiense]GJE78126.1 hypothetical protein BGCPKDLD_4737 [Methylorubrum suomiense]
MTAAKSTRRKPATKAAAPPEAIDEAGDAPMPTTENTAFRFKPGQGTSILDIKEIVLMQLLQLSGGPEVEPGALRHQMLSGERFNQLSPEAQKWFVPIATKPPEE